MLCGLGNLKGLAMEPNISSRFTPYLWQCLLALFLFYFTATVRQSVIDLSGAYAYAGIRLASMALFLLTVWQISTRLEPVVVAGGRKFRALDCGDPLLFLRFMACFFVLMQHGMGIVFKPDNLEAEIWNHGAWLLFPSGWVGVWIFFVLSGYLMGKGYFAGHYQLSSRGILAFYGNRLLRIVPLYYIAILIVAAVTMPQIFLPENIGSLISILLFDNAASVSLNPIGALWSIAVEMQFYIGAPILAVAVFTWLQQQTRKQAMYSLLAIFIAGALFRTLGLVNHGTLWFSYVFTSILGNIDLFVAGMALAFIMQRFTFRSIPLIYGVVAIFAMYIAGAYIVSAIEVFKSGLWKFSFFGPSLTGLIACAVILIFENASKQQQAIDGISRRLIRLTQLLGILTFPIYAFHEPIYFAVRRQVSLIELSMGDALILVMISLLIVLVVSYLAYHLLERPLARLKFVK